MKGRHISYSADEMAWLEANRTLEIADYTHGFNAHFGRDVAAKNLHALRKRKGWKTGRSGRFVKGAEAYNKGRPFAPGRGGNHPNAQRTQFKPGARTGRANEMYKPIGTERMSKDGYLERKVHDGLPMQSRWRAVHLVRWEEANGPIPKGHCLKSLDGNRLNTDPCNWQLISRAMLPYLGGRYGIDYDAMPTELKPAVMAIARVKHASRSRSQPA